MRRSPVVVVAFVVGLSGCLAMDGGADRGVGRGAGAITLSTVPTDLQLLKGGGFHLGVPVDVVLFGFDLGTAARLQSALKPIDVHHASLNFFRNFPPEPNRQDAPVVALPTKATGHVRVHEAPSDLEARFLQFAKTTKVDSSSLLYNATLVEDWLALEVEAGRLPATMATPSVFLVHASKALGKGHSYQYQYYNGYLEPVRVFGERHPFIVFDVSAAEDPYVMRRAAGEARVYDFPLASGGEAAVQGLAELVRDITHFRLLQGAIYPISLKPCHAVTLILGIRTGSLTEKLVGYRRAREQVDLPRLEAAFENATGGGTVHVDLKVLALPQEDPVLDAATRVALLNWDVFRYWLDTNWDRYWVKHEGCEPYVSFLLFGDAGDPERFGIGMYDVQKSHRISFSVVDEMTRILHNYRGPGQAVLNPGDASRGFYNWVNLLYAHETGHLLGQRHPHDITFVDRDVFTFSFSSVWSVMSYETGDRTVDFGAIDYTNFMRNRAGFAVQEAMKKKLEATPEFQTAMAHLEAYEWLEAYEALQPLVEAK